MGSGKNHLQMVIDSKETIIRVSLREMEDTNGSTGAIMKVNSRVDIEMVKVY